MKIIKISVKLILCLGSDIGTLSVKAVQTSLFQNNKDEITLFSKVGSQDNKWIRAYVNIDPKSVNYDFKLAIDGTVGNGPFGN